MKIAYADPPYIGQANRYPEKQEVNHLELIQKLCDEYDCWSLSCSSPSLKQILSYCPDDVRVAAWVKPFCSFKPGVYPSYAWEPVIFWHPRARSRDFPTTRDWVAANMTIEKHMFGAKPPQFCYWLFDLLGAKPTDEFYDLYPGSGMVGECWRNYCQRNKTTQLEFIGC